MVTPAAKKAGYDLSKKVDQAVSPVTPHSKEMNDRFSLWLNESLPRGEALAGWVIEQAQKRERAQKKVTRKKVIA